jgi:hypothetical protein
MRRIPFLWLLIFLLAILLLTASGRIAPQDEETTYRMAANLIEYGRTTITAQDFTVEPQSYPGFLPHTVPRTLLTTWAVPGADGQMYPQFMPAQAYLNIPLYLIGRWLGSEPSMPAVMLTRFTTSLFNPLIIAMTGWLIAVFASRLGHSIRLSAGLGVTYSLGSMAIAYASTYFSEPLIALLITLAAYAAFRARDDPHCATHVSPRSAPSGPPTFQWKVGHGQAEWESGKCRSRVEPWLLLAGSALGLAVYTRERSAIMLPAFFLYVFVTNRRLRLVDGGALIVPIVVAGAIIGVTNWQRFGSPATFGFSALQHTSFVTPVSVGLYGLLISPGKGLLLYNPIAWIGLIGLIGLLRHRRAEAMLFAVTLIVELVFFATYEFWTGGWNWGPRYILPVVPLLVLAAGEWLHVKPTALRRAIVVVLCLIGILVNLPAALVDQSRYLVDLSERDPDHYLERTTLRLSDSPLIQQWPIVLDLAARYMQPETWLAAQQAITQHLSRYRGDNNLEALSTHLLWIDEFFRLNVPDFWFIHLLMLGFSPASIILTVTALLILLVVSARKTWLMLR